MPVTTDLIGLIPEIEKFYEEFLDPSLNCVETDWDFQYLNLSPSRKGERNDVYYNPPRCKICEHLPCIRHKSFKCGACSSKCHEHRRPLTTDHLMDHFSQVITKDGSTRVRGTLAIVPIYNKKTKFIAWDFDNEHAVRAMYEIIIPKLNELYIEYLLELPQEAEICKAHLIIKTELMDISLLKSFVEIFMTQCGFTNYGRENPYKIELFPTHKASLFRLPGGVHLRTMNSYDIVYRNQRSHDPEKTLYIMNSVPKVTERWIKDYIEANSLSVKKKLGTDTREKKKLNHKFNYVDQCLPISKLASENMPDDIKLYASNCQAINFLINSAAEAGYFKDTGEEIHNGLKYIANVALNGDAYRGDDQGEKWLTSFLKKVRGRSYKSHNIIRKEDYSNGPPFISCATWERDFNLCNGCVFKNRKGYFTSPKQLLFGRKIKRKKIKDIKLLSVDEIRNTTFKRVKERLDFYIDTRAQRDLVLASPPSSGKSFSADEWVIDWVLNKGKTVLIAVPSAKLAFQHKANIESKGVKVHVILSHQNTFKNEENRKALGVENDCPEKEAIQYATDLGVGSRVLKKKYCKDCPFVQDCRYPFQYKQAREAENKVVIIQHAHFSCRETLYALFKEKHFDILIVDEEFIHSTYKEVKPSKSEIVALEMYVDSIPWVKPLHNWLLNGGVAAGGINPTLEELQQIKKFFDDRLLPWNVSDFIRHYNAQEEMDKRRGIFVFYPLPEIDIRIFTDATPPIEMLEVILDNNQIEVLGDNEIIDYTVRNASNSITQVLDASTSKSYLSGDNYAPFYELLEFIGDDISSRHLGKKILITTYLDDGRFDFKSKAEDWLSKNYPHIFEQCEILISHMAVGTNEFSSCLVQYQIAGVNFNTLQLHEAAYKIKSIANYWNRINGRVLIPNMYPWGIDENADYEKNISPMIRVELNGEDGPGLYEYDFNKYKPYEGLFLTEPADKWLKMVFELGEAKKQQAMRIIRNTDGIQREVIIFDKSLRKTQAVTKSVLIEDLIGYLRE